MLFLYFVLYIDVLSVSMRFSVRFCIYEHIQNYVFATLFGQCFSGMTGMQNLFPFCFKVVLRSWDLSHRVERHKLMVTSWEETAVRPQHGLHIEGQVSDRISVTMSYSVYWNKYIKVERLRKQRM